MNYPPDSVAYGINKLSRVVAGYFGIDLGECDMVLAIFFLCMAVWQLDILRITLIVYEKYRRKGSG